MPNELREMLGIETQEIENALVRAAIEKLKLERLKTRAREVVEVKRVMDYLQGTDVKYIAG